MIMHRYCAGQKFFGMGYWLLEPAVVLVGVEHFRCCRYGESFGYKWFDVTFFESEFADQQAEGLWCSYIF